MKAIGESNEYFWDKFSVQISISGFYYYLKSLSKHFLLILMSVFLCFY